MNSQEQIAVRLRAWFQTLLSSWVLFWRRPMVRFGLLSGIVLIAIGCSIWWVIYIFYPVGSESAMMADRITPQTKLEQLLTSPTTAPSKQQSARQWISCSDVRRVLTDTDRIYVGCRGGVLITNMQGDILRQYSQADGLTNDIVTDLLVLNKKIFVGSQDGVSVIDMTTHQITPVRVQEGLVNGSNISLVADGNDVWVGTFDGVSRIASDTLAITNYRTELADNADIFSVHRIFVTPKAVYISLISSAHSQGGLARFDKTTQTFTKIPSGQFFMAKNPLQITTINYLNSTAVGDQLVLQDGNSFWLAQDKPQMRITLLPNISEALSQLAQTTQISGVELLGTINSQAAIRFLTDDAEHLAVLTPKTKEVRLVAPQDPAFPLVQAYSKARPADGALPHHMKANRPFAFGRSLAAIDTEAWVTAQDGIWTINVQTGEFQRRLQWPDKATDPDRVWLVPLVGTNQAVLGRQVCGMGCIQPDFWLVQLQDYSMTELKIPEEMRQHMQNSDGEIGALDYVPVEPPMWEVETNQLKFQLPQAQLLVDIAQNQWKVEQGVISNTNQLDGSIRCHQQYHFNEETKMLGVEQDQCPNQLGIMRLGDYAFKIQKGTAAYDDWLSDGTGKKIAAVAASDPIYSSFPGWTDPVRVVAQVIDEEAVWLAHNRGIARYAPSNDTWQVISSDAGLSGPIVEDMLLIDDKLVVLSRGGLAIIPTK
jgi:hypothetical protein